MASRPPTSEDHFEPETVLTSLTDEKSRRIVEVLSEPKSAREIATECQIPLSTTYRKLNDLSEASLVAERIDVSEPGKHTTRYVVDFDTVTVELGRDASLQVRVESSTETNDAVLSNRWRRVPQKS